MSNRKSALWAAIAVLLLAAVVLLILSYYIPAVICLALTLAVFLIMDRDYRHEIEAAQKSADNYSKALEAEKAHNAMELQALKQQSIDELEDFRSILSHQLRMPLSIVQGYADILIKDMAESEEEKQEYLKKIVERTQYISELLSNQLSIYRNVDEVMPVFKKIDLIALLNRVCEDMQTVAKNQGIDVQSISALDSLTIEADSHQLNKVVFNILENSLKYMGREGHINIVTSCDDKNAFITIKDDGMGLDSEETEHIFELNYQGSNKKAGHGHGLYLARRATEAHGGTISASSAPGMGMAIKITLPLCQPKTESK